MAIHLPNEGFSRNHYLFSFEDPSNAAEVYGFSGNSGRIHLEGQLLRPSQGRASTALLFMHPATSLALLPLPTALASAGFHVMCCASRYLRNDTPLILEKVLLDLRAHIEYARDELGYEKIVLVGWSGGGSLSLYYQAQAEQPSVTATPAGDAIDIPGADLIKADAILSIAAHLSRAETLTEWLDPSVQDENDPEQRRPEFDIYAADAKYRPPFTTEYIEKFRDAQRQRNRRITERVEHLLGELMSREDGEYERGFIVHRTMCDPRWIDPAIDANGRRPNWCYLGDPRAANVGPTGLARYTTLRSWLSQWSLERTLQSDCR